MNTPTRTAVIYANEQNVWDEQKNDFVHVRPGFDESSYAIAYKKAAALLTQINVERMEAGFPEAYMIEIPADVDPLT